MQLRTLLGRMLKDDLVLDVLEHYQIESVVYDFDRNHENIADLYWAAAQPAGFQLRFNQDQILDTIFCYIERRLFADIAATHRSADLREFR